MTKILYRMHLIGRGRPCRIGLLAVLASVLLYVSSVSGNDLTPKPDKAAQRTETGSEDHGGLTPHRKTRRDVVLAQQPTLTPAGSVPPAPQIEESPSVPAPVASGPTDAYVYAELERLSSEVRKLRQDTKKPDTKKAWGSPKVTGRFFLDAFATKQDEGADAVYPTDPFRNKGGVREMQLAVSGSGFDAFDYKLELSLAPTDGKVNLVDNWVGVKNLPLFGYVRAGHFKPETGLNYPASALHTTLTEFSGPSSTFGFGRRVGVASETLYARDRVRLFYGVFQDGATNTSRFLHEDNQGEVFNMRLSMAPYYAEEGRYVLHLGGHWSYVGSKNDKTVLNIKPGSIDWYGNSMTTGDFANNNHHRLGLEFAWQAGPFCVQSEAFVAKYSAYETVGLGAAPDRTASGAYVELKYFLTGEHRTYGLAGGMFGAAKVNRNFHPTKCGDFNLIDGFGAWQAVLQYGYLDLGDWRGAPRSNAGRQHDITLGLNWFWTPNLRWIFEYTHSQQNVGADYRHCSEDIFGTSMRVHF